VALAPLFQHRHSDNFQVRQISFIGTGASDYLGLLAEPELSAEASATVLQFLASNRDRWDICDLQELPWDSPLPQSHLPRGLRGAISRCSVCLVLQLPADAGQLYRTLPAAFRRSVRHSQMHASELGEIRAARCEDLDEYLDAFFRLHAARWEALNQAGVLATPSLQKFHREVAHQFLSAGILRLYVLRLAGRIGAALYGFAAHNRTFAYLGGFDPTLAKQSPGSALVAFAIERSIEEHAREFDFLRDPEDFKYKWGAADRHNQRMLLWHSDSRLPSPDWPDHQDAAR
jgi:CelD/BcsL family acetyltransferase involved in cellulose biosynthesis